MFHSKLKSVGLMVSFMCMILVLFLVNCKRPEIPEINLKENLDSPIEVDLIDIAQSIEYIPLSNENHLIRNLSKVIVDKIKSRIIVLSTNSFETKLYIQNLSNGAIECFLSSDEKGPNGIEGVTDVAYNEGKILLLNYLRKAIYSLDDKCRIEQIAEIPEGYQRLELLDQTTLILESNNNILPNDFGQIVYFNLKNAQSHHIKMPDYSNIKAGNPNRAIWPMGEGYIYSKMWDPSIYYLNGDGVEAIVNLNFGSLWMDGSLYPDFVNSVEAFNAQRGIFSTSSFSLGENSFLIMTMFKSEMRWIFLKLLNNKWVSKSVVLDGNSLDNTVLPFLYPVGFMAPNKLIFGQPSPSLYRSIKDQEFADKNMRHSNIDEVSDQIGEFSNPVLMLIEIKDDIFE